MTRAHEAPRLKHVNNRRIQVRAEIRELQVELHMLNYIHASIEIDQLREE